MVLQFLCHRIQRIAVLDSPEHTVRFGAEGIR